jgi:hypothetical protein
MVKQILLLLLGLLVGSIANTGILKLIGFLIPSPVPPGNSIEDLATIMQYMEWFHFIGPWLAHATGTLVGALIVRKWSRFPRAFPLILASFFFLGGLFMVYLLPGTPVYFILADLVGAYFPMAALSMALIPEKA